MTVDGQAQERVPDLTGGPSASSAGPMPVNVVLDLCDRLLGEIGRRQHRFAWLRPPGSGIEDCLVCDAYYPGNRLVAICREEGSEPDPLYAEQVPGNGLLLLMITPSALGMDRQGAADALLERIGALGPLPQRPGGPAVIERPQRPEPGRANGQRAESRRLALPERRAPEAARPERRPPGAARPEPRPPEPARPEPRRPEAARAAAKRAQAKHSSDPERDQRFGMLIGLALALVVAAESLILVIAVSLGHDHPALAFGFALDACARSLGTIAAAREGNHGRAWACIVIGSPAVVSFVLPRRDGAIDTEPGPLAGVISVLAIGTVALALLGAAIGI